MARLNIEDEFWMDILGVVVRVGDHHRAIGMAVHFFRVCQDKHKSGSFLTEKEFKELGFTEDLIPRFAKKTENGIEAVGANKHFSWLLDRADIGRIAGKISAEKHKEKYGTSIPINAQNTPNITEHAPNMPRTPPNIPNITEPSSSSSCSNSKKKERGSVASLTPLAILWNEHCGELPKVEGCGKGRITKSELRWREHPSKEYWLKIIDKIRESKFCNGNNDRGWKADFDFLIKPETDTRAIEGKYDDRIKSAGIDWSKIEKREVPA